MPSPLDITFAPLDWAGATHVLGLVGEGMALGPALAAREAAAPRLMAASEAAQFTGATKTALELFALDGWGVARLVLMGCGAWPQPSDGAAAESPVPRPIDWLALGGQAASRAAMMGTAEVALVFDVPGLDGPAAAEAIADVGLGASLRAYRFDVYKSKAEDAKDEPAPTEAGPANGNGTTSTATARPKLKTLRILCADPAAAEAAFSRQAAIRDGVCLARDLVNEPANRLGPVEFAARLAGLSEHGLRVAVWDEKRLAKEGFTGILAVGQGSARPPRLVVMQWTGGAKRKGKPIAFVGKGICFDSGGISIKPAQGMEDMKGDMAGAAAVAGVMLTLALRKAPVYAVGVVALAENMPSGTAQRPGDVIDTLSGQTVEVINTDAEGRLVLADALHHTATTFEPVAMIDLATLTGAIMVALGTDHAGLFSNDDALSERILAAGLATGEKCWRMPMGPKYDSLIASQIADMKNVGGRYAGAITAAQFLKRFVGDTPWAHLDIAGTGMASPKSDISDGWASGFGVRLLDRLVAEHYERN